MKEEKRAVTVYIADDGKEFDSAYACNQYEIDFEIRKKKREWLNSVVIQYMKTIPGIIEHYKNSSLESQASWIDENIHINCCDGSTYIGYKQADGYVEEFDESCPFDYDLWQDLEKKIYIMYGYKILDQSYYWPK